MSSFDVDDLMTRPLPDVSAVEDWFESKIVSGKALNLALSISNYHVSSSKGVRNSFISDAVSLTNSYRLAVGSACGSIRDIFTKIKAIDAKHGKFDFALCTGDFFGPLKDAGDETEDELSLLLNGKLEGMSQRISRIGVVHTNLRISSSH